MSYEPHSRASPVVGLLPLTSGQAFFGVTLPSFLMKQLNHRDLVINGLFVGTGHTTRR